MACHASFLVLLVTSPVLGFTLRCARNRAATEYFFADLVAPLSPVVFFERYWDESPVLIEGRSAVRNHSYLFSLDELELMLDPTSRSSKRLQPGHAMTYFDEFRIDLESVKSKKKYMGQLPAEGEPLTSPFVKQLRSLLRKGATMVIGRVYAYWEPMLDFVMAFEQYFEARVHANIYITPAGFTGRRLHSDHFGGFILQLSGRKRWRVWKPFVHNMVWKKKRDNSSAVGLMARDHSERDIWIGKQQLLMDKMLNPGDVLYVPRGFLHEASSPRSPRDQDSDGTSVHLTVSPEVETWAEFFDAMPFTTMTGQPSPPGRTQFRPSGKFMPFEGFELQASYGGSPQSLRKLIPLPLSQQCGKKSFKELTLQRLHDLDSGTPLRQITRKMKEYGRKMTGYIVDVIQDLCLAFDAVRRRDLLSARGSLAKQSVFKLDRPWCVQSSVAARVLPDWLAPPGFDLHSNYTYVIHSRMNGPVRYSNLKSKSALPLIVPSEFRYLFIDSLHAERNPSGVVWPRDLIGNVSQSARKKLKTWLKRMLKLDILQPQLDESLHTEL